METTTISSQVAPTGPYQGHMVEQGLHAGSLGKVPVPQVPGDTET